MQPLGGLRVHLGQLVPQGLQPLLPGLLLELLTHPGGVGGEGGKLPPGHEVVDVQPGAPCHNGQLASGENVVHDGDGLGHIAAHGEVLPGVCHVQHVVGHPLHFLRCGLGGADVHATVDLHGVSGHHFPV